MTPAVIFLTEGAADIARRIADGLDGARLHGPRSLAGADVGFETPTLHLQTLFAQGSPIVGVCASGILIRALAPVLGGKSTDPPVVSVAADGSAVVPLLGGHRGANDLARRIAALTEGAAAITTASEAHPGFALDSPPPGWRPVDGDTARPVMAALVKGEPVRLETDCPGVSWPPARAFTTDGELSVQVTDRVAGKAAATLTLHPPTLALGIGCERDVDAPVAVKAALDTLARGGLALNSIAAVGSVALKADEPAVRAVAEALSSPLRLFEAVDLERETPRLANPSDLVYAEVGCHGVAEAAALALAGDAGELVVPKERIGPVTIAVARSPTAIVPPLAGRASGRLSVVGIGPGDRDWRTAEAVSTLLAADDVVGYALYLDLVNDVTRRAAQHPFPIGAEDDRVVHALNLAASGRTVALVASGDPGIYALATLVFERLAASDDRSWRGVDINVVPGLSALQAAAARSGAPLGHDFCAISLSDLLTPSGVIERRIRAAAEGDFAVVFYNPQSRSRRTLLESARQTLLAWRPAATPLIVARNLGRPGEDVRIETLGDADLTAVDMLSLVIVGNSETRLVSTVSGKRVFAPRGYGVTAARQAEGP